MQFASVQPLPVVAPYVKACRPKQWIKNPLFVMAPLLVLWPQGVLSIAMVGSLVLLTFILCLLSSSVYLVNDVVDVDKDRLHPSKRFRPIAAGLISSNEALIMASLLASGSLVLGWWLLPAALPWLITYLVLTLAYTFWAKQVAYLELVLLASMYGLRALAGFIVTDSPPLPQMGWVAVAVLAALYISLTKRYVELLSLGSGGQTRKVLSSYSPNGLSALMLVNGLAIPILFAISMWPISWVLSFVAVPVSIGIWLLWRQASAMEQDVHPMSILFKPRFVVLGATTCLLVLALSSSQWM